MAFNNGFPMAYQPFYGNQGINYQPPMQTPSQGQAGGITWVSGEAGAKAYLVAPNNTVQLWDSEAQTIYLKSADASGMPTMKVLDYTIRNESQPTTPIMRESHSDYVTRDEFNAFVEKFNHFADTSKKIREDKDE
jgi:hypothetical protein